MAKIRKLTADEVSFYIECRPEDTPINGNVTAIDPETDRRAEADVRRQLRNGNEWAWCCVRVVVMWNGFEGDACLGCCSYESEAQFKEPGGYYDALKTEALDDLNSLLAGQVEKLEALCV